MDFFFGRRWKTLADTMPTDEEFAQEMQMAAAQAIQMLMQQAQQKAQVTGVKPNPREVMAQAPGVVEEAQSVAYNPALAQENQK